MALWKFSNLNKYGNIRSRIIYRPDGEAFNINPKGFGPFIGVSRFKYESRSYFQPSLVQVKDKKYMVPDWKEVLPETTINDIKKSDPKPNSKKGQTKLPNVVVKSPSSSSDEIYTTTYYPNSGKYYCDCPGTWRTAGNCKHVKKMKNDK
tara:strand:- start:428 stop:874 length:447 start_codon:yes stop_codon:yes gene_type:complete